MNWRAILLAFLAGAGALVVAPSAVAAGDMPAPHPAAAVDWVHGDPAAIDAAFARARSDRRPLFLYWGAVWCPPCNQVKATVFNRQDFIERARFFVPVYIDGDSPGAQKLGARFKVSGYPTMILFSPDGAEITRLPGEVDAARYMDVLALGLGAARPARAVLAAALAGGHPGATPDEWRMLAYYAWDTDDQQLVPRGRLAATLQRLARACPAADAELGDRLALRALVAAAADPAARAAVDRAAARERVERVLGDERLARADFDLVTGYPAEITGLLTALGSEARLALAALWDRALARLVGDATLSTADRLGAVTARVQLARLLAPTPTAALPAVLQQQVVAEATRADRATTDAYERQSVISAAADALAEAGLIDDSDALLKAELARSHSPYYFMVDLAVNARKRGDTAAALDWHEKAYAASQGAATRLQWGTRYVRALLDLAPGDEARIERALDAVLGELEPKPEVFYGRNRQALDRLTQGVLDWNRGHRHEAVVQRARARLASVCAGLPAAAPEAAACRRVLVVGAPVPSGAA